MIEYLKALGADLKEIEALEIEIAEEKVRIAARYEKYKRRDQMVYLLWQLSIAVSWGVVVYFII